MKFATMTVMVMMTASSLAKPKCKLERQFQVFGTERPISWQAWVGLTLIWDVPPSCPAAQPVLPISHQPRQNQAEGGTAKIKVNPTQVRQEMGHPVDFFHEIMQDCDIIFPDGHSQHEGVLGVPLGQDLPSPRQRYDGREGGRAHLLAGKLEWDRMVMEDIN